MMPSSWTSKAWNAIFTSRMHFTTTSKSRAKSVNFTISEDLKLLKLKLFHEKTWKELGEETGRGITTVRVRWNNIIQPFIIKKGVESKKSFHAALEQEYETVSALAKENGDAESYFKRLPRIWTSEHDRKLEKFVKKMKIHPKYLLEDFPGMIPADISRRYDQILPNKVFSPDDDAKLKEILNSRKLKISELQEAHFPNHGPKRLYDRIRAIKKAKVMELNDEQLQYLCEGVKQGGRSFLYVLDMTKFPNQKPMQIMCAWAFYEPVDQINAVWTRAKDAALIRNRKMNDKCLNVGEFSEFYVKEMESRYYRLSTSDNPELKDRFQKGSQST